MSLDCGIVGLPNVGKSTIFSALTAAPAAAENFPFCTIDPNVGIVELPDERLDFLCEVNQPKKKTPASVKFVDIAGLIKGASQGEGLGDKFLRHIERTKVIIHMVDAASVEGRDPVEDIKAINEELSKYNPELLKRPQVIAANKIDALPPDDTTFIDMIKEEFEPQGIKVFPISAVSGKGLKELLWEVQNLLDNLDEAPIIFEQEFDPDAHYDNPEEPFYVFADEEEEGVFHIEGPRIDKMLGYTNLESEKGFQFFQNFLKDNGILDELEALGIQEGDTVRMYGLAFNYYK